MNLEFFFSYTKITEDDDSLRNIARVKHQNMNNINFSR